MGLDFTHNPFRYSLGTKQLGGMGMNDFLYGINYKPETVSCPKQNCDNTLLYELKETHHYLCIECGHQFPVES